MSAAGSGGTKRFLMVAPVVPIEVAGTNIVVRRLLQNFASEEVVLLARPPNRRTSLRETSLHYPVVRVKALPSGLRGERFWRLLAVVPGVVQGWRAIRRFQPSALVAMFPDEFSLMTGYLLARLTGIPLLVYFCDLYVEERRSGTWEGRLAHWLQGRALAATKKVLANNQALADFYRERYGVASACIPTCINQPIPEFAAPPEASRPYRIGYSGNVNEARTSSMRALVEAIGGDPDYTLRYFTPQSRERLEQLGVWASNVENRFVADEAALVPLLAECDVLFLPLTFEVGELSRDYLATCFGVKSYEYFLARRPIVVHSPGDYFLARFFASGRCGVVVDDPKGSALRHAFERLRGDRLLGESLVRQGLVAARQFEGPRVAETMRREIGSLALP